MTRIALFKRDHRHTETAGTRRMCINALDSWHAEFIQIVPDAGGADDREKTTLLIRWIIGHERVCQNRLVAIMHGGHFDQRATGFRSAVVTGKFTERSFAPH